MIEEILDVPLVIQYGTRGDKAENFHAAVVADVKGPGPPSDVDIGLEASDGTNSAVATEPDHQLVVTAGRRVVDVSRREEIVRHIRASVLVANGPGC